MVEETDYPSKSASAFFSPFSVSDLLKLSLMKGERYQISISGYCRVVITKFFLAESRVVLENYFTFLKRASSSSRGGSFDVHYVFEKRTAFFA